MSSKKLRNIRRYLYRNGRHLDVARWNFHFEDGGDREVLKALALYQNREGDFDTDLSIEGEKSSSRFAALSEALGFLREFGFPKEAQPLYRRLLRYLGGSFCYEESTGLSPLSLTDSKGERRNPEAVSLGFLAEQIGFLLRFADEGSLIREKALLALKERVFGQKEECLSYENLEGLANLGRDLQDIGRVDLMPEDFLFELKKRIDREITRDQKQYRPGGEFTPPSAFILGKKDFLYEGNEEICAFYADYLEKSASELGYWEEGGEQELPRDRIMQLRGRRIVDHMLFIDRIVK